MAVWTAIFIEPMPGERTWHWVWLTNDDDMDGEPDGRIAVTQGTGPLLDLLKLFGQSRVHEGRVISVYVNGEKK